MNLKEAVKIYEECQKSDEAACNYCPLNYSRYIGSATICSRLDTTARMLKSQEREVKVK